jgi:EF hand
MKTKHQIAILAMLTQTACGMLPSAEQAQAQLEAAMSDSEQAANELYLDDLTEATAEGEDEAENATSDESVKSDVDSRRLGQMADSMFKDLDADSSGSLSKEEFLAGPLKRAEDKSLADDKKAKVTEKMGADFDKYAGDDAAMSPDELKTMLTKVAPRVGHHRAKHHPGKQDERVKSTMQNINNKFDANKDGKIGADELSTMRDQRKNEIKDIRTNRLPQMLPPPPPGAPQGPAAPR